MRDKEEVKEKFEELLASILRKRKEEFLSQACRNCEFNSHVHIKGRGKVRLCMNKEILEKLNRDVFVCEDDEVAQRCSKYQCKNTKEQVEKEFDDILRSPSRCGNTYPKLAILIWFLQEQPRGNRWERCRHGFNAVARSFWHFIMLRWW